LHPEPAAGYNCTLFAYGPTAAGKTYSMLGTPEHPGMMLLSLVDLFKLIERRSTDYRFQEIAP
jgi:kinesin family protein 18/19